MCIDVFGPGRPGFIFSILAGITLIGLPFLAFAYRQMTAGTAQARPGTAVKILGRDENPPLP